MTKHGALPAFYDPRYSTTSQLEFWTPQQSQFSPCCQLTQGTQKLCQGHQFTAFIEQIVDTIVAPNSGPNGTDAFPPLTINPIVEAVKTQINQCQPYTMSE